MMKIVELQVRITVAFLTLLSLSACASKAKTIHAAAVEGSPSRVQEFLAGGADVNAPDAAGATPLHRAARYGHASVVELLVAKGANVNATDKEGKTPLDRAREDYWSNKDVIALLRRHGANTAGGQ